MAMLPRAPGLVARARGFATVAVRMTAAPVLGPALTEGVGVVESAAEGLKKGDLVFARGLGGTWGDAAAVQVDPGNLTKLPEGTEPLAGATFGAAATAYRLTVGLAPGGAVVHLGAEGPVGQAVAQLCAARGCHALSFVSAEVPDPEEAVDVLKNLGATAAAPAAFAAAPAFRELVKAVGAPSLMLVDASTMDMKCVDAILAAAKGGVAAGRKAVEAADPRDVRDAKTVQYLHSALAAGGKVCTYGGPGLASVGATAVEAAGPDMEAFAEAGLGLTVFAERHTTATLPKALHAANGAVRKHAFRTPLWVA